MQTDFPTVEIHFVFASTYCRLRVYKPQEEFVRKVLELHCVEFLGPDDTTNGWQDFDARVLLDIVNAALPKMLAEVGVTGGLLETVKKSMCLRTLRDLR